VPVNGVELVFQDVSASEERGRNKSDDVTRPIVAQLADSAVVHDGQRNPGHCNHHSANLSDLMKTKSIINVFWGISDHTPKQSTAKD